MEAFLGHFIQGVESLRVQPWAPAAFIAAYGAACLVMPVTLFAVAGGVLFGFWGGLLCNMAAALIGSHAAFWLARRLARERIRRWLGGRMKQTALLAEHGFLTLLAVRLLGFPPFLFANYLAGLSSVSWQAYLGATVAGMLPWTVFITYFAQAFWHMLVTAGMAGFRQALAQHGRPLIIASLVSAALVVASALFQRKNGKG